MAAIEHPRPLGGVERQMAAGTTLARYALAPTIDFRGRTTIGNLNSSEWLDGNGRAMIFVYADGPYV